MEAILQRANTALNEAEYANLEAAMEWLIFLTKELKKTRVLAQRLKKYTKQLKLLWPY